jgi:nitrite reductase/ring-hydroxylating ferredoxin subunit
VKGLADPILVFRAGTQLVATQGMCPHEAIELDGGDYKDDCITCPGHAYEFDVITGRCKHDPNLQLKRYPARVENGELVIEVIS